MKHVFNITLNGNMDQNYIFQQFKFFSVNTSYEVHGKIELVIEYTDQYLSAHHVAWFLELLF